MRGPLSILRGRSLFWKIYISMIAALFVPLTLFSVYRIYLDMSRESKEQSENFSRNVKSGASLIAFHSMSMTDDELASHVNAMSNIGRVEVFVRRGGRLFAPEGSRWANELFAGQLDNEGSMIVASADAPSGDVEAFVVIDMLPPIPPGHYVLRRAAFVIVAVGALFVAFFIVRGYTAPLEELGRVTARLGAGDLSARADERIVARSDEIADLASALNWMAASIERSITTQKRLLVDISHEIRSPLQRMDVALALARRSCGAEAAAHIDRVELEIDSINVMIEELLDLTRSAIPEGTPQRVELAPLVEAAAADAAFEGQMDGKSVSVKATPMTVVGSPSLTRRAVSSVIDNAIRYAPRESCVEITASPSPDGCEAVIRVRDRGEGVAEHELEHIFEPYYRTDAARAASANGTGLGLAITKRVAEDMGGSVRASNAEGGGLVVEIRLPLA